MPAIEAIFGGLHNGEYPGAFPPKVDELIRKITRDQHPILHLFSGSSNIGDVRVDVESHPNVTHVMDAFNYIKSSEAQHKWSHVIGDPDYNAEQQHRLRGNHSKASSGEIFADPNVEREISQFLSKYAENILWLDRRMPYFDRVRFERVWSNTKLFYQGGWRNVRVFEHLRLKQARLDEEPALLARAVLSRSIEQALRNAEVETFVNYPALSSLHQQDLASSRS